MEVYGLVIFCQTLNRYVIILRGEFAVSSTEKQYLVRCLCNKVHETKALDIEQSEIDAMLAEAKK